MQKILITIGLVIVIAGLLWPWITKLGLGRLPGDIAIEKDGFNFYFPVMTSIIISVLLTVLFWIFRK